MTIDTLFNFTDPIIIETLGIRELIDESLSKDEFNKKVLGHINLVKNRMVQNAILLGYSNFEISYLATAGILHDLFKLSNAKNFFEKRFNYNVGFNDHDQEILNFLHFIKSISLLKFIHFDFLIQLTDHTPSSFLRSFDLPILWLLNEADWSAPSAHNIDIYDETQSYVSIENRIPKEAVMNSTQERSEMSEFSKKRIIAFREYIYRNWDIELFI